MLQPGQIIGDMYRIERMLGSGGMADVFVVKHTRLPKQFALKVMRLESGERTSFLERFRREAEILATLKNAHLVEVFDRNEMPDGNPYLVMELLEGEDLSQFLTRSAGPLSVSAALNICNQVGEALDAAHQVGVVHRDLKPSNIFLCQREAFPNFVKVLDFGIAKQTQAQRTPLTAERSLMGTPGYMAPEQALGRISQIDHRTDQFALAAILYEMLAGKPAFYQQDDTTYSILNRVVNEHPPPLKHAIIHKALQRALSKNPEERFPSIKAFLAAAGANNLTIHVPTNVPEAVSTVSNGEVTVRFRRETQPPPPRKLPVVIGVSAGGLLAVGLLIGLIRWWPSPEPAVLPPPPEPERAPTPIVTPLTTLPPVGTEANADPADGKVKPPIGQPGNPDAVKTAAGRSGAVTPPDAVNAPQTSDKTAPGGKAVEESKTALGGSPNTPGTVAKPTTSLHPPQHPAPQPRSYQMSGVFPAQEKLLQQCATTYLNNIPNLNNQIIKLERSGALQITDAPEAVHSSNFGYCIRKVFTLRGIVYPVPESVIIRIRGGR